MASTVYGIVHANFAPELNAIIYIETESQEIIDYVKTLYNYKPIDEPNQLTESFRSMMKRLSKVVF